MALIAAVIILVLSLCGLSAGGLYWYKTRRKPIADKEKARYRKDSDSTVEFTPIKVPFLIDEEILKGAEVYHYQQEKKKLVGDKRQQYDETELYLKHFKNTIFGKKGDSIVNPPFYYTVESPTDPELSDGNLSVYECKGPAAITQDPMEVYNPLFEDEDKNFCPKLLNNYAVEYSPDLTPYGSIRTALQSKN